MCAKSGAQSGGISLGSSFMNDNSAAVTTKGIASQDQVPEIAKSETESAQEYRHLNRRREKAPMPRSDPLQFSIIENLQPHLDEPEADRPDDFDRRVAEALRKDTQRPGNRPDDAPLVASPSPGRLYAEEEVMARVAAARLERGSVEPTLDSSRAEKRKGSISLGDSGTPRPSSRCLEVARLKLGSFDLDDSKIESLVESSSTTDEHRRPDAVPQAAACFEDEDDEEDIKLKLEESQLKQEQNQLKQKLRKMEKARLRVEPASGALIEAFIAQCYQLLISI
ncbi:hypothetical protein Tdes44962_MAKER01690 [Teratosphaeria destructans]|uniref:Uncharacterized protein n=1 Tax=Teratosphaeria destructans TaxID=418781 RepID=A0A9W7SYI6_9PEZI|nr:hypothetical protein Tdes44962_MAKER01690 [Teratosphaeria destructans]